MKEIFFTGGTIITMDDGCLEAESVVIQDGRIVHVGDDKARV